jgi:succinate dehydrogenase / fumarate reductase cytochrome b subunit
MTHFAPIKAVSYLLYLSIIVHAIYALIITMRNKKARPIAYAKYDGSANSKWNSRNMGILGTIILVFLVVHMGDFWYKYHWGENLPHIEYRTNIATGEISFTPLSSTDVNEYISYVENGEKVVRAKDLYKVVEFSFQTWYLVLFYLLAMVALGFHLAHGFKSAFATLGFRHNRYTPVIQFLGVWIFGVLIPIGFALMPLYFFFK